MGRKRVVVTGMGLFTPIGKNVDSSWNSIISGESAIRRNTEESASFPSTISAAINYNDESLISSLNSLRPICSPEKMFPLKHTPKFTKFALTASIEAISQSKLLTSRTIKRERIGVIIGSGFGEINAFASNKTTHRMSPYFIPGVLMNSASAQAALCFGFQGPSFAVSSACATGSHSIGLAFSEIQNNKADAIVCGGAEHTSNCRLIHEGFYACRALASRFKETPEKASRPFDRDRCGFVLGEGAGVVVLEEMEHAKKRGAVVLAEILGHGQSTDSYHITSPSPNGEGAQKAISSAILSHSQSKGFIEEIGFISAHASSTKIGDLSETRLIRKFFGNLPKKPAVYSIKGSLGHSMGASGAVEAIVGIKALNEGILPPTLNLENLGEEFDLDFVRGEKRKMEAKCFLANSFGFGGHNSCLLIGSKKEILQCSRVLLTGEGVGSNMHSASLAKMVREIRQKYGNIREMD